MKPYELIEHTADVGIKVRGRTLKELFENSAKGMFGVIRGTETAHASHNVAERRKIEIKKEADGFEELLVDWLSELLYIFNKDNIIFSSFNIIRLNNKEILGEAAGEKIGPAQADFQVEIKAVTFHGLKIKKSKAGFNCSIIFDV